LKILLDECVPRRFRRHLAGHEVKTAPEAGLAGVKNGELLQKAAETFDVLITVDRNLSFQQNPWALPMAVIVIHAQTNKLKDLEPQGPKVVQLLQSRLSLTVQHIKP